MDGLISGFVYQGVMKRLISKYKYKFISDLNQTLIELLISELKAPQLFNTAWALVPIPLHPKRLRWRGFNQAALLAKGLSCEWDLPLETNILKRDRHTQSQMQLSASQRRINLKGAFSVSLSTRVPDSILLVDDVATSCATLRESARVLKQAGVTEIWGLTLAQAIPS
jgi:ComF family protein